MRTDDRFTDVRLHGEPTEGQAPVVCMFLKFLEYLIGLCVVPRAASNQVDLSAGCTWLDEMVMTITIELPIAGQNKRECSKMIPNIRELGNSCVNGCLATRFSRRTWLKNGT